jgi:hypothetical protein
MSQMPLFQSGRVALVSCSAAKASERRPAAHLYLGQLFLLSAEWVELRRDAYPQWAILSAEHGLVMPDQDIDPYDTRMADIDRHAWGARVAAQIRDRFGLERIYTVLAGADYSSPLTGRMPYLEMPFEHWAEQHRWKHPRGRWGIGRLKQRLKAENDRLRESLDALDRDDESCMTFEEAAALGRAASTKRP